MSEQKNNFILVHDNDDNSLIMINEDYIICMHNTSEVSNKDENIIRFNSNKYDGEHSIDNIGVNETAERIYNQLSKSKFIKVHNVVDNSVIVISIKDIVTAYRTTIEYNKIVTTIELNDCTNFDVHESVETVMKLCKENT